MDDGRVVLQRLHQVGFDGVFEQSRHGALRFEVTGADGCLFAGVANNDVAQALFQVAAGGGQTEDGHHLGRHHNVKAVLTREAIAGPAQRDHRGAQGTVVHVHDPAPDDAPRVKPERVTVVDVVVHQRGQQVVGQRNGVEITREVQVDVLHRHHLGITAAGRAAFHAKHRPQ